VVLESVLLGMLAAIGWGISDFVVAVVSKRLGVLTTVLGVHVAAVAVTTVYLLLASSLSGITLAQWSALAGAATLATFVYIGFYRALQIGPVVIVSPIISSYAVVVIVLATIFIGERLNGLQILGTVASIGGVVLVSLNPQGLRSTEKLISTGILIGILATVGLGLWQYTLGVLSRDIGWFLPIYVSRMLTLAILIPVIMSQREWPWLRLTFPLAIGVAFAGIMETGGLFAFTRGAEVGVISIVAAASTTYPILPILGGLVILRERLTRSQVVGLVVVLLGLLMLSLST